MHPLLKWLRRNQAEAPPSRDVSQKDVDEEIPDELQDGYEGVDPDGE